MDVYTVPTTRVGNETNIAAWTLVASGSGVGQGANNPTPVDVTDFTLGTGQYGIALVIGATCGHDYTNGTGTNQVFSNADLTISAGAASNVPFTAGIFDPRVWNRTLYYTSQGGVACASSGTVGTGCGSTTPLTLTPVRRCAHALYLGGRPIGRVGGDEARRELSRDPRPRRRHPLDRSRRSRRE
jgi:hypothetical protein